VQGHCLAGIDQVPGAMYASPQRCNLTKPGCHSSLVALGCLLRLRRMCRDCEDKTRDIARKALIKFLGPMYASPQR